ncbi:MAG TPA: hypothetical protein VI454_10765, partial [Verrucomicrobiae bacterium]
RQASRGGACANQILFAPPCPAGRYLAMRDRALIVISVVLNLALGVTALVLWRQRPDTRDLPARPLRHADASTTNQPKTRVVVRRQFFNWTEVESDDYRTYIANLRDIGCPEKTIRDIVVADINEVFERRRLREIIPDDPAWWKGNPGAEVAQSIARKQAALDGERRALLTELLGSTWEPPRSQLGAMIFLTGPVLGALPAETKLAVQDIVARSIERENQARREKPDEINPAAEARRRQQTREELAKVLTPQQLEEYLLRWSQNSAQLRAQLRGVEVEPDEFRALFRATDALEQELQLQSATSAEAVRKQQERLQQRIDDAFKLTLDTNRYAQMKHNQDTVWVQTRELAAKIQAPPELVQPLYELTRAGEEEIRRIREDKTLTTAEQEEALAAISRDQADTLRELLGEEGYRKYKEAKEGQKF